MQVDIDCGVELLELEVLVYPQIFPTCSTQGHILYLAMFHPILMSFEMALFFQVMSNKVGLMWIHPTSHECDTVLHLIANDLGRFILMSAGG